VSLLYGNDSWFVVLSSHCAAAAHASSPATIKEPHDEWTIEELLHWSLHQYQLKTHAQADHYIEQLRDHCSRECQDITTLHQMAVEMASRTNNENAASSLTTTGKSPRKSKSDHIEILITSGPHSDSKVLLRPKPNAPCFIGRSKGKKFINNGISLSKDQEVSTTHAKIVVEMSAGSLSDAAFYFVDVGSTNGSTLKGEMLEPEVKVKIVEGMEIKVGGSTLKFILG
jgi:pSer/pThr/pTyr-binding forkhead associated (FHA) protein